MDLTQNGQTDSASYDAVLIDDDILVQLTWKSAAKSKGKLLICFDSPEEFLTQTDRIPTNTPIYLDFDLGQGKKGQDYIDPITAAGFREIHIATGFPASAFASHSGITSVVGKDPPF
jgi:hypothetical protein